MSKSNITLKMYNPNNPKPLWINQKKKNSHHCLILMSFSFVYLN